jgi:uncharacterized membrane protein YhaH (DUF805 family)
MNDTVQLVFFGEILQGFQRDEVQRRLGELLRLDETKHAHLFSGERRVLKRSVTRAEAERYVQHLAQLGARLHVEPEAAPAPVQAPAPAPAPAEEEIACPNCGERQSRRIMCRACATNMPMGIAAKEEAEREAREARRAEWRARRGLAPAGDMAAGSTGASGESAATWGLGLAGRIGRRRYMTAGFVLFTVMVMLAQLLMKHTSIGGFLFFGAGMLGVLFMSMRLAVLRLHDFNRSGWWSLVMLVPYLGGVASLVVALLPGTEGSNEHGDVPRKGSWVRLGLSVVVFCLALGYTLQSFLAFYSASDGLGGLGDNPALPQGQAPAAAMAAAMLPSGDARAAFEAQYQAAAANKVFAVSSHGGWGLAVGKPSLEDALEGALSDCESRRPPYTPECRPVNVNGQWGRFEEQ